MVGSAINIAGSTLTFLMLFLSLRSQMATFVM